MAKQRRPVYVVQRYLGKVNGEKFYTIICIKQTRIGADREAEQHKDTVVIEKFLVD